MVKITDECISCGACLSECPVEAIMDEDDNPQGNDWYYVMESTCVECVGHYDEPACAQVCPTEGAFVWSNPNDESSPARPDGDVINQNVEIE